VTADHQKVVHPQEDLKEDLLVDQKVDLQEAVILTGRVMTQVPLVNSEVHATTLALHVHLDQNQLIVFHQNANLIKAAANASPIKAEIVNHLMESANLIKEANVNLIKVETANHLMASVNPIKAANASLLAELKIQHEHPIKEIIAGIAMLRPR
jgi:hypothetical protein